MIEIDFFEDSDDGFVKVTKTKREATKKQPPSHPIEHYDPDRIVREIVVPVTPKKGCHHQTRQGLHRPM